MFPLKPAGISAIALALVSLIPSLAMAEGIRLDAPDVVKLDWGTRSLSAADINGDGRTDLLVINNDTAKIDILYQRDADQQPTIEKEQINRDRWEPILEDSRFDRSSVIFGDAGFDLTAGDFNNDGRMDIALTANLVPLRILFQDENGDFSKVREIRNIQPRKWPDTMETADLDGDGRDDLLVLGETALYVYFQSADGKLAEPIKLPVVADSAFSLQVRDLNGDDRPDLQYMTGSNLRRRAALRLQRENGTFGPELAFPLKSEGNFVCLWHPTPESDLVWTYSEERTDILRHFTLESEEWQDDSMVSMRPRVYGLPESINSASLLAAGDFNRDGELDIVVAAPREAAAYYYQRNESGDFAAPESFPSFSGLTGLHAFEPERDEGAWLLALSESESLVGVSAGIHEGRFSFPRLLKIDGKPYAAARVKKQKDAGDDLVVLSKSGRDFLLSHVTTDPDASPDAWQVDTTSLGDLKRPPEQMQVIRLDPSSAAPQLVMLFDRSPARLFKLTEGEDDAPLWEEFAVDSDLRKSLLGGISVEDVQISDLDEDGISEILLTHEGYIRAVGWRDGDLAILDQFNTRLADTEPSAPFIFPFFGTNALFYYNDRESTLEAMIRDDQDVFRFRDALETTRIDLLGARSFSDATKRRTVVLAGKDRFWVIMEGQDTLKTVPALEPFESDLRDVSYALLLPGSFLAEQPQAQQLVAVDSRQHVTEFLGVDPEGHMRSLLHFEIFESSPFDAQRPGGGFQPREVIVGDYTSDGFDDIAMLIHDRVLVYPQK